MDWRRRWEKKEKRRRSDLIEQGNELHSHNFENEFGAVIAWNESLISISTHLTRARSLFLSLFLHPFFVFLLCFFFDFNDNKTMRQQIITITNKRHRPNRISNYFYYAKQSIKFATFSLCNKNKNRFGALLPINLLRHQKKNSKTAFFSFARLPAVLHFDVETKKNQIECGDL